MIVIADTRTGMQDSAKWREQIEAWRNELGAVGTLASLRPWTGTAQRQYTGISQTDRVLNILDCVAIEKLGGAKMAATALNSPVAQQILMAAVEDVFVDVSQNPVRRAYTGSQGLSKCLHTATSLYSFQRDGVILPYELMQFQGHGLDIEIPSSMRQKELKDLAGQGICLPCLGLVVTALLMTVGP